MRAIGPPTEQDRGHGPLPQEAWPAPAEAQPRTTMIASISMAAPRGSADTCTVERAG